MIVLRLAAGPAASGSRGTGPAAEAAMDKIAERVSA